MESPMDQAEVEAGVSAALARLGLARPGEAPRFTRLTGGVSSDIWRVDLARGPVCVKRALPKLRVAADWFAPVERNAYEAAWMRRAAAVVPEAVPELLGQDPAAGVLVMAYLDPARHALWKAELRDGRAAPEVAAAVGERLARIHAATADDPAVAAEFATDRIFYDIRLEPYLVATAAKHPDRADALHKLVATTAATRRCLVHGDVSPKNILLGPRGPVFLDAECAWYGDPAFDLAFCLNHLLLKCLWTPRAAAEFLHCFGVLATTYLAGVAWEQPATIEGRIARLLPGLFLGRVDGKSPIEYLTAERDKDRVRKVARALLAEPVDRLGAGRAAGAAEGGSCAGPRPPRCRAGGCGMPAAGRRSRPS
jgi:aminoglycoside phosphotransferase (APT) family kinase protein